MAMYAVESQRQPMTATGIVEPVFEWEERPDGSRRPSKLQARSLETGMPLWAVEVIYEQVSFGRVSHVTAKVTVGAEVQPAPARMSPILFTGLRVEVRINKAGGFVEVWFAEALPDVSKSKSGPQGSGSPSAAA